MLKFEEEIQKTKRLMKAITFKPVLRDEDTFRCDFCSQIRSDDERNLINIKIFGEDEFDADVICNECNGGCDE